MCADLSRPLRLKLIRLCRPSTPFLGNFMGRILSSVGWWSQWGGEGAPWDNKPGPLICTKKTWRRMTRSSTVIVCGRHTYLTSRHTSVCMVSVAIVFTIILTSDVGVTEWETAIVIVLKVRFKGQSLDSFVHKHVHTVIV